ncbi:MAG: hypothetical protein IPG55_11310 [Saprospiraceae bacterium]|nr:hypothetical protein [Candidatus Defluviibacterium haderslevense]MBK7244157.1 hypothetical protein [Candidatus Defluviibacterium haderslevense]
MKYKLNIENSCTQDWESMGVGGLNKFCQNCQKTVIDFSKLNDFEISRILDINSEHICGRFKNDQLNRPLNSKLLKSKSSFLHRTFTGILLITSFSATNTLAQKVKTEINSNLSDYKYKLELTIFNSNTKDSLSNVLQGKILDWNSKEPMQSLNISILNSSIKTNTDDLGNFILNIPDSLLSKSLYLVLSYPSYLTSVISVDLNYLWNSNSPMIIEMQGTTMGLVEVCKVKPKKWWQIWKKSKK